MRVLVAEDERLMADAIAVGLRRRAIAVDLCYDGDAALERVMVHRYDVVILDRDLPGLHGDELCRRIVAAGGENRVRPPGQPSQSRSAASWLAVKTAPGRPVTIECCR